MLPRCRRSLLATITLLGWTACAAVEGAEPRATTAVDFDREIQPLLTSRCLKCHGGDEPQSGLQFTDRDHATAALDSGRHAIVPGRPDESELIRRVSSADPDERMPSQGEPLSVAETDLLRRWIAAGADWPRHWAYRPLVHPPGPAAAQAFQPDIASSVTNWPRTPIDTFILAKFREQGLTPAPPADKRSLLRRLYFDLIGLPPLPDEIDAFLADEAPDAYERVVDRLLASPHYGERWARHWMDLVHFAETHGHDQDRPRDHAWPYRDYLIRAFNADVPYARFVREQVAGDVLFPDDPWAVVATGFLAAGPWDESSLRDIREDTLDREIARYLDRDDIVTTVMNTFTSTTVQCARCHQHKFDPISQHEYYALQAVFAATDKANRAYDLDPDVARRRRDLLERKAQLPRLVAARDATVLEFQQQIAEWERTAPEARAVWQTLEVIEFRSDGGATLEKLDDGSLLAGGNRPEKDVYTITARAPLPRLTGLRLDVLTHESLPQQGPGRAENGNLHLNEVAVTLIAAGGPSDVSAAERRLELVNPQADFNQEGWSIEKTLDGNPDSAWGIHPQEGKPHRALFELREPIDVPAGATLRFDLHQTHGRGHVIGRVRLAATDRDSPALLTAQEPPAEIAVIVALPAAQRSEGDQSRLLTWFIERAIERELAHLPKPQLVYCGTNRFDPDGSFRPALSPRSVHVLHRGEITQPRHEAHPGALSCIPELPPTFARSDESLQARNPLDSRLSTLDSSTRRAALADWLADDCNVLTWRSIANRAWQHHFGRGLVTTPNDFGRMGAVPTHPELLDWLAAELRDSGGSLKRLHRLIVTSAVYRQASEKSEKGTNGAKSRDFSHSSHLSYVSHSVDPDNLYLSRFPRRRLDAESIRDAALHLAGTLDRTMGGPSVRQFVMSPGVHVTPVVDYAGFNVDDPANHRRSVYRFNFRTLPDPFMDALDCPDGSQWTPQRSESVTAIQALATLNDKLLVRQCDHLAARAAGQSGDIAIQVEFLFRLLLGRPPSSAETTAVLGYTAEHGLPNAARLLINTNEFVFVD